MAQRRLKLLAGDLGGTKLHLAFFEEGEGAALSLLVEDKLASGSHASLQDAVLAFTRGAGLRAEAACFGVPGPVRQGRARITNLPWVVDAGELSAALGIPHVYLLNDLEATGHCLEILGADHVELLQSGEADPEGNAALIAAGTGLGEAGLYRDGERLRPFASEGGHTGFCPETPLDQALLTWLQDRFGRHVSWERIVSGPGLVSLYRFLREHRRIPEPDWLTEQMRAGDPAAAISRAALDGRSELCSEALDLFVGYYGAAAGNLALKMLATGGLWIGGGIAPKILDRLATRAFLERFRAKGRMAALLEQIPVKVILEPRAALYGPAHFAAERCRAGAVA